MPLLKSRLGGCVNDVGFERVRREVMKEFNHCVKLLCTRGRNAITTLLEDAELVELLIKDINYYRDNFVMSVELLNDDEDDDELDDGDNIGCVEVITALSMATASCDAFHLSNLAAGGFEKVLVDYLRQCAAIHPTIDFDAAIKLREVLTALKRMIEHNHNASQRALMLLQEADITEYIQTFNETEHESLSDAADELIEAMAFAVSQDMPTSSNATAEPVSSTTDQVLCFISPSVCFPNCPISSYLFVVFTQDDGCGSSSHNHHYHRQ